MSEKTCYPAIPDPRPVCLRETTSRMSLDRVMDTQNRGYINEFNLFIAHFGAIPNFIHEIGIDCRKASPWFYETYREEIKDLHYNKRCFNGSRTAEYDDLFWFLFDDLIVNFDTNQSRVRFLFRKTPVTQVEAVIAGIRKFKSDRNRRKPEISLLYSGHFGLETKTMPIGRTRLNIAENYNDDFAEVHRVILRRLSRANDRGIVLLHGRPGTGKTFYIRHLISRLRKTVIFLPPHLAGSVTDPGLISLLIENPNSVFVIEDAEQIITDRELEGRSPVSALLNIADGLLSDCLNIQLVCSFNTGLSRVDRALLRKGRLIASYEFRELSADKARRLSLRLGHSNPVAGPMTLTEIYNQGEVSYGEVHGRKRAIGFGREG